MRRDRSDAQQRRRRRAVDELRKRDRGSGRGDGRIRIEISGCLDLIGNADHTRRELRKLTGIPMPKGGGRLQLVVDLGGVLEIDASALLYLAASVDHLSRSRSIRVRGTYPRAPAARAVFADAKFHEFMGPNNRPLRSSADPVLKIRSGGLGRRLDPNDWIDLHAFLENHGFVDDIADVVYRAFGECVENVHQHAFEPERRFSERWYALGIRGSHGKPGRVVIVDLGIGIAGSLRAADTSRTRAWTTFLFRVLVGFAAEVQRLDGQTDDAAWLRWFQDRIGQSDWFCTYLAVLGASSRTGRRERGNGLSGLHEAVTRLPGIRLHVLTGRSTFTLAQGGIEPEVVDAPRIRGTVVCIDLGSGSTGDHGDS